MGIANGSSYELQTQLVIANKLNLLSDGELEELILQIDEMQKMTYSFQKMLKNKLNNIN